MGGALIVCAVSLFEWTVLVFQALSQVSVCGVK